MPTFVASSTELSTAATDLLLAMIAMAFAVVLIRRQRRLVWSRLFITLSAGSLLGAAAHAFKMEKWINDLLWYPIYFLLGLTLTLLALAAIEDWRGADTAHRARRWLLPLPLVVVAVTALGAGEFIWFILFEALIILFALGLYTSLARHRRPGAQTILAGIILTLAAAIVQASGPLAVDLVWQFDHNGLYHLIQIPGLFCFFLGALKMPG